MQAQTQCPSCGTSNPTGKVFCISCGNALMGSPASQGGSGTPTRAVSPPSPPPPAAPYSGPSPAPQALAPAQRPQTQPPQSSWLEPTQAYPLPTGPSPAAQPPPPPYAIAPPVQPVQPTQPVPYQSPFGASATQYPPPPQYPTGQAQYDPYPTQGYGAAQPQYGQYGQYPQGGQPSQYINVQITGAYPYGQPPATDSVTPTVQRSAIAFWGLWLLATAVAWAIAMPAGLALANAIDEPLMDNVVRGVISNSSSTTLILIVAFGPLFAILGAVVGLVSGILQWLVFMWKGLKAGSWVFASVIGWMVGAAAGWAVSVLVNTSGSEVLTGPSTGLGGENVVGSAIVVAAIFGGVAGAVLGFMQYFALQKHTKKAGLWLLASPLAWVITMIVFVLVVYMIAQSSFGASLDPIVSQIVYGAVGGVIAGATTGAAIAAIA